MKLYDVLRFFPGTSPVKVGQVWLSEQANDYDVLHTKMTNRDAWIATDYYSNIVRRESDSVIRVEHGPFETHLVRTTFVDVEYLETIEAVGDFVVLSYDGRMKYIRIMHSTGRSGHLIDKGLVDDAVTWECLGERWKFQLSVLMNSVHGSLYKYDRIEDEFVRCRLKTYVLEGLCQLDEDGGIDFSTDEDVVRVMISVNEEGQK